MFLCYKISSYTISYSILNFEPSTNFHLLEDLKNIFSFKFKFFKDYFYKHLKQEFSLNTVDPSKLLLNACKTKKILVNNF